MPSSCWKRSPRDDVSVGELLARQLLDLAAAVPGLAEAMRWPERTEGSAPAEANDTLPAATRAPAASPASSRSNASRGDGRPSFDTRQGRVPAQRAAVDGVVLARFPRPRGFGTTQSCPTAGRHPAGAHLPECGST